MRHCADQRKEELTMLSRSRVLAALAGACAAPTFLRGASADDAVIKIAAVPFDVTAQPYYCDALGLFKKVGLSVELDSFTTSGAVIAASVASGTMDIGVSNLVSLATAHVKGLPFVIIAPSALYSYKAPADALMVPLDSPIKTAQDLNGKTIGTNGLKNITEFGPRAWIDQHGGDSTTVKFVEIAPPEQGPAMAQGRIDAACVTEPYLEPTKKVARVLANCFDAIAPTFMISGFFTTLDWARAHANAVKEFQDAMRQSARWANANQDKSAVILAQAAKVDPDAVRKMYRAVYTDKLDPALMQPVIDVTAKYAGLARFDANDLIYHG
jgi:NitT/TauT family transport system substrate-binding protein